MDIKTNAAIAVCAGVDVRGQVIQVGQVVPGGQSMRPRPSSSHLAG